jgi:hypothetical protein
MLTDLARQERRRHSAPLQAKEATVRTDATADTDQIFVSIDAQDLRLRGPCRGWQPRGAALPAIGDKAVVVEAQGDGATALWVIAWWPQDA